MREEFRTVFEFGDGRSLWLQPGRKGEPVIRAMRPLRIVIDGTVHTAHECYPLDQKQALIPAFPDKCPHCKQGDWDCWLPIGWVERYIDERNQVMDSDSTRTKWLLACIRCRMIHGWPMGLPIGKYITKLIYDPTEDQSFPGK